MHGADTKLRFYVSACQSENLRFENIVSRYGSAMLRKRFSTKLKKSSIKISKSSVSFPQYEGFSNWLSNRTFSKFFMSLQMSSKAEAHGRTIARVLSFLTRCFDRYIKGLVEKR